MINLSSRIIKIFRFFLLSAIILNASGVLLIHFFIPEDIAITYDLSLNISLIVMCSFVYIISINLVNLVYDENKKQLIAKNLYKNEFIAIDEITILENVFPGKCRITYKQNSVTKTILFIPKISIAGPFSDSVDIIKQKLSIH